MLTSCKATEGRTALLFLVQMARRRLSGKHMLKLVLGTMKPLMSNVTALAPLLETLLKSKQHRACSSGRTLVRRCLSAPSKRTWVTG